MERKLNGLVTGVNSGDHLLVQGKSKEGEAPPTHDLYLAYIDAPKMPAPQKKGDAFALASREFVRKLVIGKKISFLPAYSKEGRDYATVWVESAPGKTVDVVEELVAAGLATVRAHNEPKEEKAEQIDRYQTLKLTQDSAMHEGRGLWTKRSELIAENAVHIAYPGTGSYDHAKIQDEINQDGGVADGIVEYVFSPCVYSIYLPKYKAVAKLALEYVHNPPGGPKATEAQQKISKCARAFVERLVQHRDVTVQLDSFDATNASFLGKLLIKEGVVDVAAELLTNGFAKLLKQEPTMDAAYYVKMRLAMNQAQTGKKGLWKDPGLKGKDEEDKGERGSKFTAHVIEVHSGDSLTVAKVGTEEERRVFMAGIRAPNMPTPANPERGQPYAWEAKEHLRKMLVGKQVEVELEYTKTPVKGESEPADVKKKAMTFVNILLSDGRCVNVEMVELGLASMLTPRVNEVLTAYYVQMGKAVEKAKAAKKGIYAVGGVAPVHSYQDLVGPQNTKTLMYYQEFFSKNPHVSGVVEHCFSGSRFKLRVEEATCFVSFICQGLQPLTQDPNVPELQKLYVQGQKFARSTILQRDARVDIESSDRRGNFFGVLTVAGKNYTVSLLEEGLAVINRTPGREPISKRELYDQAETKAKKEEKGFWDPKANISMEIVQPGQTALEFVEGKSNLEIVTFASNRYFYAIHTDDSMIKKLEDAMKKSFDPAKADKLIAPIRRGTYCMAKYTEDKKWYRAQVERAIADNVCEVLFIDYGNTEDADLANVRKIDSKLIKDFPPRTVKVNLAYLDMPPLDVEAGGKKLRTILKSQLEEREVTAIHKYKADGVLYAILLEGEETDPMKSFNAYLLKRGLAKISRRVKLPGALIEWQEMQDKARTDQVGLWETNELNIDDDEDA